VTEFSSYGYLAFSSYGYLAPPRQAEFIGEVGEVEHRQLDPSEVCANVFPRFLKPTLRRLAVAEIED
jgi:hypothetical protein